MVYLRTAPYDICVGRFWHWLGIEMIVKFNVISKKYGPLQYVNGPGWAQRRTLMILACEGASSRARRNTS